MSSIRPFSRAYDLALPHGILQAIHLPGDGEPVPEEVLKRLQQDEAAHARTLKGHRQVSWVGGRLALRLALRPLVSNAPGVLTGPFGEPLLPDGISASISHKTHLAVAMAARGSHGHLGIDLEDPTRDRSGIAPRVLRPEEIAEIDALPESRRWTAILLRFALKEALYKALFPRLRRYVGFEEARVRPGLDGSAQVELFLKEKEGPFQVEARYHWIEQHLLAAIRLQPMPEGRKE
jgi:4'-phosphopantetheinyl transferase EntD